MTDPHVLVLAAQALRRTRTPLDPINPWYVHHETVRNRSFAQGWFMTSGCRWDRRGECTTCNYGQGPSLSEEAVVDNAVAAISAASSAGPLDELFISPSGSMLDPVEVPIGARRAILQRAAASPAGRISFETRPSTVDEESVADVLDLVGSGRSSIGLGLESADPWVRVNCIGRRDSVDGVLRALRRLRRAGIACTLNVTLGAPFLAPHEALADAVDSIEWAVAHGAEQAMLFPIHVKANTVVEHLWRQGRYRPPSLWLVAEALVRLSSRASSSCQVAWYRALPDADGVVASPGGCPRCERHLLRALDAFRHHGDRSVLQDLVGQGCSCRSADTEPLRPREARVRDEHRRLAMELGVQTGTRAAAAIWRAVPPPTRRSRPRVTIG